MTSRFTVRERFQRIIDQLYLATFNYEQLRRVLDSPPFGEVPRVLDVEAQAEAFGEEDRWYVWDASRCEWEEIKASTVPSREEVGCYPDGRSAHTVYNAEERCWYGRRYPEPDFHPIPNVMAWLYGQEGA